MLKLKSFRVILTLILALIFSSVTYSQVTSDPPVLQSNISNCKIVEVKIENNQTVVTVEYEKTKGNGSQAWVSFSSYTFLSDYNNPDFRMQILGLGNESLNTRYATNGKKGMKYYFTLIFPKLPPGIDKLNLKEITADGSGFEWRGISIKNADNSPKSSWSEASLKEHFEKNGTNEIEGIYENAIQTEKSPKYRLALKKTEKGYSLIYLSGGENFGKVKFNQGDVKAYLTPTAKDNFFKTQWIMGDKTISENLYITFEEALMKIIWTDGGGEQIYLKLYPSADKTRAAMKKNVSSSGTGFALSNDGYIVTNYHVIDGAKNMTIKGIDGDFSKAYPAKVIVSDKNNDLAILQVKDADFHGFGKIPYAIRSGSADVGESIFVMGYPLRATMGDEIKLTNGIVSSKTGFQGDITSYQISAPIQPGNSGGPMFDKNGQITGIINAKHIGAENASYAIKTNYLKNLIESLPKTISLGTSNPLTGVSLSEQVKLINKFVYIIEVN